MNTLPVLHYSTASSYPTTTTTAVPQISAPPPCTCPCKAHPNVCGCGGCAAHPPVGVYPWWGIVPQPVFPAWPQVWC